MTTLNTIKSLVSKLKREELKSLLKYLRYYQDVSDGVKGKSVQLIEAVINDPLCTQKDIQVALYGNENYHAFNKLLNRTKDKIYEVLLFDQNLSKPHYSERNRIVLDTRKKLIQSQILYLRGMTDELESFQNKIISKAIEYEVYDTLIEALESKQRYLGFNYGRKTFEKIEKDIYKYEKSRIAVLGARSRFTKIGVKINEASSSKDYLSELIEVVNNMQDDYLLTNSPTIGYYMLYLQTELYQIEGKYQKAEETLNDLLKLVINNPSVYTKVRHGDVILNISVNNLFINNFPEAVKNALLAKKYFENNFLTQEVAKEVEFYAHFYNKDLEKAEKIIQEIYNSSRTSNTPFLFSKRAYLYACIKTIKGEINQSNELLHDVNEIEKDKEGWNLHYRILTIINRIETKNFESVDMKVLSLEKFIKRILKFRNVRKRDVIILRILLKLINEGFDFYKVYEQRKKYFDLLEGNDPDYKWKIKSPELIIFHEWFKKKIAEPRYVT